MYEEAELAEAASHTVLTYGLNGGGSGALFDEADPSNRHYSLRTRPNLYGATHDWLHLAGPDRRPRVRVPAGHECLVAGWLELQCWWRYVARSVGEAWPSGPDPKREVSSSAWPAGATWE